MNYLFADAGFGPLVIPILGGLGIAGLFLSAAVIAGGFWLVRGSDAPRARKVFLTSTAAGCLGGAALLALLGQPRLYYYWIAAAVLAVIGVAVLLRLRRAAPSPPEYSDDAVV